MGEKPLDVSKESYNAPLERGVEERNTERKGKFKGEKVSTKPAKGAKRASQIGKNRLPTGGVSTPVRTVGSTKITPVKSLRSRASKGEAAETPEDSFVDWTDHQVKALGKERAQKKASKMGAHRLLLESERTEEPPKERRTWTKNLSDLKSRFKAAMSNLFRSSRATPDFVIQRAETPEIPVVPATTPEVMMSEVSPSEALEVKDPRALSAAITECRTSHTQFRYTQQAQIAVLKAVAEKLSTRDKAKLKKFIVKLEQLQEFEAKYAIALERLNTQDVDAAIGIFESLWGPNSDVGEYTKLCNSIVDDGKSILKLFKKDQYGDFSEYRGWVAPVLTEAGLTKIRDDAASEGGSFNLDSLKHPDAGTRVAARAMRIESLLTAVLNRLPQGHASRTRLAAVAEGYRNLLVEKPKRRFFWQR